MSEVNNLIWRRYAGVPWSSYQPYLHDQTHTGHSWEREPSMRVILHPLFQHTSHRILDPQDASDKVRRLAEHPGSPTVTVTLFNFFSQPPPKSSGAPLPLQPKEEGGLQPVHMSHHLLPDEQPQPDWLSGAHTHTHTHRRSVAQQPRWITSCKN